jgi:septum formation protein
MASRSPQRERLLREAGFTIEILVPDDGEPNPAGFADTAAYTTHTAWLKARQVATRVDAGLVLAADTVCSLAGKIIGKPADRDDARRILNQLSGSVHQVITGVCVWRKPQDFWLGGVDVTDLAMRPLSPHELELYLSTERWVEKAGAYAIQDPDPYVSIIRGSRSNVVGLPMELVEKLLASIRD